MFIIWDETYDLWINYHRSKAGIYGRVATTPEKARFNCITSMLPKWEDNLQQDYRLYKNFIRNYDYNPHFYRFLLKETKNITWIKNHRSELSYLLLLDILSETTSTIYDANQEYDEDKKDKDRTRQRRLLRNEYYPELAFLQS